MRACSRTYTVNGFLYLCVCVRNGSVVFFFSIFQKKSQKDDEKEEIEINLFFVFIKDFPESKHKVEAVVVCAPPTTYYIIYIQRGEGFFQLLQF